MSAAEFSPYAESYYLPSLLLGAVVVVIFGVSGLWACPDPALRQTQPSADLCAGELTRRIEMLTEEIHAHVVTPWRSDSAHGLLLRRVVYGWLGWWMLNRANRARPLSCAVCTVLAPPFIAL